MRRPRGRCVATPPHLLLAAVVVSLFSLCTAGPLGSFPNVTSADLGIQEGSCGLGDVVYMPGDEFPGSGPCEKCTCTQSGVQCTKQRCEPRPGCKALHRPDHCCPTYQCECEQEGRVYGNGEKLVDPADPCRVCYCQGGEVVCRRIACFVRDDCRPRLVPGRCCPEYDNCPLRGITTAPGMAPSISSFLTNEDVGTSAIPSTPKENIKQEITIKEITPVSEIPVITNVKIKEILPSSIYVAEYSSSKSPLIPREATTEKQNFKEEILGSSSPTVVDVTSSSTLTPNHLESSTTIKPSLTEVDNLEKVDKKPSKISFSTQDSINSEVYPSNIPTVVTIISQSLPASKLTISTTKAPIIEEEDLSLFDHNPAFPPLPDDLSVLNNHDDEMAPEQSLDGHLSGAQEEAMTSSTEAPTTKLISTTTTQIPLDITTAVEFIISTETNLKYDSTKTPKKVLPSSSPTINLRSAIPSEVHNISSKITEISTEKRNIIPESNLSTTSYDVTTTTTTVFPAISKVKSPTPVNKLTELDSSTPGITNYDTSTQETSQTTYSEQKTQDQTTSAIAKSNIATEVTLQTELSSLPIETSDQNPHETIDSIKEKISSPSSQDSQFTDSNTPKSTTEEALKEKTSAPNLDNKAFENIETTEFILTSFGSSETATDSVELIKISPETEDKAAYIEPPNRHKNVLTDLINLVGDVASISDQTDEPTTQHVTSATEISDSEELIPVHIGYKSKNKNYNQNTITELPMKSKNSIPINKQKIVEIEDDEPAVTDSLSANDKVEPTTKRPIIDKVSDDMPENTTGKNDIEIIRKEFVPTVSRRPTKVVMKKSNEKPLVEDNTTEIPLASVSLEIVTETSMSLEDSTPEIVSQNSKAGISTLSP